MSTAVEMRSRKRPPSPAATRADTGGGSSWTAELGAEPACAGLWLQLPSTSGPTNKLVWGPRQKKSQRLTSRDVSRAFGVLQVRVPSYPGLLIFHPLSPVFIRPLTHQMPAERKKKKANKNKAWRIKIKKTKTTLRQMCSPVRCLHGMVHSRTEIAYPRDLRVFGNG